MLDRRFDEMGGIADHEFDARVVQRALMDVVEIAARHADDFVVELGDDDPFDACMLEQLARGAAVAAAEHERLFRRRVRERGRMRHALVVDVLVADGRHRPPVEREQPAELRGFPDFDLLVRGRDARKAARIRKAVGGVGCRMKEEGRAHGRAARGGQFQRLNYRRRALSRKTVPEQADAPGKSRPIC